jgi:hypothetical protein
MQKTEYRSEEQGAKSEEQKLYALSPWLYAAN